MQQLDPPSDQTTASSSKAAEAEAPVPESAAKSLERRRAQRRAEAGEPEVPAERRKGDRRKRKPGLPALLGAILAVEAEEPVPEDQH